MTLTTAQGHLTDEALLLLSANELGRRTTLRLSTHLQQCASCQMRQQQLSEIEDVLDSTQPAHERSADDAARARLQASLLAAPTRPSHGRTWPLRILQPAGLLRIAAVLALCVVAATFRQASRPLQDLMSAYEKTGPKPDRALTPGSARLLSAADVCRQDNDDLDPRLSLEKQHAVFHAYRMNERASRAYQVDYLINPQLGGDDSLANLWPEPYHATVWNATAKDALETRLRGLVCSGQLDLQSAQRELADDWIAAYKKYFRTARPVSTVAAVSARDVR